ncbi:uncharacterized protein BCR38DRAFT_411005 [Pseudomassariella vexata]|uniref:Uncharacterized protein n=1 Tax=Pseudomassariella vexata TaxID=1141098 RepID=A0A1Y2DTN2_9PEZI|nr:uncharacterized protein BCR38DRAFT_411005 [Pseudomassariella vexata]ORY62607.1 hypothetical protein BCR38DRAFT_411005 [Pseudomassariella vexata]
MPFWAIARGVAFDGNAEQGELAALIAHAGSRPFARPMDKEAMAALRKELIGSKTQHNITLQLPTGKLEAGSIRAEVADSTSLNSPDPMAEVRMSRVVLQTTPEVPEPLLRSIPLSDGLKPTKVHRCILLRHCDEVCSRWDGTILLCMIKWSKHDSEHIGPYETSNGD